MPSDVPDAPIRLTRISAYQAQSEKGLNTINKTFVTEEGARTLDHKVKSLALYQLSYSGPCLGMPSLGDTPMRIGQVTMSKSLFHMLNMAA